MSRTLSHKCCTLSQVFPERISVDADKNSLSLRMFQVLRIVEIQKVFTRRERVNVCVILSVEHNDLVTGY